MKKWLLIGLLAISSALHAECDPCQWTQFKRATLVYQNDRYIQGWCTPRKAEKLMDLVYQIKPQICVEIGVFGGSSIYPTASALKFLGTGVVYAIDPWLNVECIQGYNPDNQADAKNYEWWGTVNLEKVYQGFRSMLHQFGIADYCITMRMTSQQALPHFADESIDILHIDGNHTAEIALMDVTTYLPKVKKGGFIWMDDANWATTQKAVQYLKDHCTFFEARSVIGGGAPSDCYLFQKL